MESRQKLHRCMILSHNQETSEEFAKWLTGADSKEGFFGKTLNGDEFQIFCRWPNCPKGLPGVPASDALIIYVKNLQEWSSIREYVQEKTLIHFKVVIWDIEIPGILEEFKPNIIAKFSEKKPDEILEEIIKADNELDIVLKSVFENFDKMKDGYIDFKDMETICRELGLDVTHTDFKETLRSLDFNHDNKISFEEFTEWWKKGRQCTKLMENLISMRMATSSFLNINSKYLDFIKEKIDYLNKEKTELIKTFISLNLEKIPENPELTISLDGYFGGEAKKTISKSYVQNFEEGLKSTDFFVVLEFQIKDSNNFDKMRKFLTILTNTMRESFNNISRKFFSFINNEVSIKVIQKNNDTLCLSFKLKKVIREDLISFENIVKSLLDDQITQTINLSFCLSGNVDKVKLNPTATFLDSFDLSSTVQLKAEIMKKNVKLFTKYFKPLPTFIKILINSFGGSHLDLNFNLDYLKSWKNPLIKQTNQVIIHFIKNTLKEVIQETLSSFGGFSQFKKFYDNINDNFSFVVNTPQIHVIGKIDFAGLTKLFEEIDNK